MSPGIGLLGMKARLKKNNFADILESKKSLSHIRVYLFLSLYKSENIVNKYIFTDDAWTNSSVKTYMFLCWVVLTEFWVKYGQTQPLG